MIQLVKNINGEVTENITADVNYLVSVSGKLEQEDYINLNGFIAYLQNFSKVQELTEIITPLEFGLKNQYNSQINTIQISY